MPLYEYECLACGIHFEVMQGLRERPIRKCQKCGETKVRKKMSAPAFQFKGTGWYVTDYASDKGKKDKKDNEGKEGREGKEAPAGTKAESADASSAGDSVKPAEKGDAGKKEAATAATGDKAKTRPAAKKTSDSN